MATSSSGQSAAEPPEAAGRAAAGIGTVFPRGLEELLGAAAPVAPAAGVRSLDWPRVEAGVKP